MTTTSAHFRRPRTWLIALCASLLLLSATSHAEQPGAHQALAEQEQLPLDDLRTFVKVFSHIRNNYVKDIDDSTLFENAIKGMLSELDPHSAYLEAQSYDTLKVNTTGEFGGLGLEVGMENGFVKVIAPIDGTPAEKAGIQSGDLIIQLDGQPLKGLDLSEAVKRMRGPKGSAIELTIVREGLSTPFNVTIIRDIISVVSVRSRELESGFLYMRIAQFQGNTGKDFRKAIVKHKQKGAIKGIVLDLRNNPGGVLTAAIDVADAFIEQGLIVYTEGRINEAKSSFNASAGDLSEGAPVIVLINNGSASASEIVAGALQDHRRAILLGTTSFGKGSVQTVIPLSEENGIKLTTALYYTPNGRSIQAQGIEPDITVERAKLTKLDNKKGISESDLPRHLSNGNDDKEAEKSASSKQFSTEDNQLHEALTLLKGLHILGKTALAPK